MDASANIGRREREILTAIVESYISTGEPVGSRTLARANPENLSAASIRNVMADLADAGFLEQPHTSAGRVPTTKAYRFYVKQLTGEARLSPADENLIQGSLQGLQDVPEFMERTSHVLSLISHSVGVTVSSAPGQHNALEHVYFQRMADKKVLAVVVMRNGVVRDRVLRLSQDLSGGRSGSGGGLHQSELPRLGDGVAAQRDQQADSAGAQRIRSPDAFGGAALRAGCAGHRRPPPRQCTWKARRTW